MFEKESAHYALENVPPSLYKIVDIAFQKGAEFGYNNANEWIYMKDINSDEEFDKYKGGSLYIWKVKTFNDNRNVEFEGFHTGIWGDLVYETYANQVECFKKIEPPKEV